MTRNRNLREVNISAFNQMTQWLFSRVSVRRKQALGPQ